MIHDSGRVAQQYLVAKYLIMNVGVENFGEELHCWWCQWVVWSYFNANVKKESIVNGIRRGTYNSRPCSDIILVMRQRYKIIRTIYKHENLFF